MITKVLGLELDMKISTIFTGLVIFGAVFMFVQAFFNATSLPDVWFSYATNDCVKVINYKEGDNFSCENLPPRFYHAWVE